MKLTFLGTRGEIDVRRRRHRMHSSLLISYGGSDVMIDCGLDWLGKVHRLSAAAIVLTHAHPDHAWGLKQGAPCPVYATQKTWQTLKNCRIERRQLIDERVPAKICEITFEAFPVEHSIRAPAVGYRVSVGGASVFYSPDVVLIHSRAKALRNIRIYIGDGATISRSFVRKRGEVLIGHASIQAQLGWCMKEHVPCAIFTHCGTEIVTSDERRLAAKLRSMGAERGVEVRIAYDRMEVAL
ncbi:MAG: MBL fold metallo-hydrolase [Terrimicrobiaceae bacterium]